MKPSLKHFFQWSIKFNRYLSEISHKNKVKKERKSLTKHLIKLNYFLESA